MSELTVGRIVRLHATVFGVLVATAMPAFATTAPGLILIDGVSLSAGLGVLATGVLALRARRFRRH